LIAACRYPPEGTRSVSLAHPAADYGAVPLGAYLERSKGGPLLLGQIETAATVDPLDELLPGLDVAFIGTTDLSVDLGRPGALDDERVRARMTEIAGAAKRAGVALGAWFANAEALAAALTGMRLRYVVVGSDLQLLRAGVANAVAATRQALA
ncbi:MAG: aldolase/citrate lyase family protein, partial [Chloroflexota bacterium]|nr:aldolase/citrate lyase family protein [Chloroflexota bacterium]